MDITENQYTRYAAEMAARGNIILIDRETALEIHTLAFALALPGFIDFKKFDEDVETTLGNVAYIPKKWPALRKARILPHVRVHVDQYRGKPLNTGEKVLDATFHAAQKAAFPGLDVILPITRMELPTLRGLDFFWKYLTDSELRAVLEAQAYAASHIEFEAIRTGVVPRVDAAHLLAGYKLKPEDIDTAALLLQSRRAEALGGVIRSQAVLDAREILQGIHPDLVHEMWRV